MDIRSKFLAGLWGGRKGKAGPASDGAEVERTIALEQIWAQVSAAINERDPEDWNQWHWLQDLYYDPSASSGQGDGQLFAVTISAGRLFRWPVTAEGDTVHVGEPVAVVVQFADADTEDSDDGEQRIWPGDVRQTPDGRWVGCAVLCTATVNKMGILDSRALFDSFVERFQGDGSEYINLLHLGGGKSQIGVLRHIWREDKLLVGLYEFAADDAVAAAVARTLAADSDGFWGGSIEFAHYGQMQLVEVAEGVKLPMTHDGKLLGYSIARNQDCAAWYTGNIVREQRSMTERERAIALELLGDEALVDQLQERLGEANRALAGAVTRTAQNTEYGIQNTAVAHSDQVLDGEALLNPESSILNSDREAALTVYELEPEAVEAIAGQVVGHRGIAERFAEQTGLIEQRVADVLGRIGELTAALEQRAAALDQRLAKLEQDEETRYRQYDAEKPKQPRPEGTRKIGVRPRERATLGGAVDVTQESAFARKARELREGRRG